MLKITPVKQQTGARFYPGDISQAGRAGSQFRAEQGFWKTFQGGLQSIGRLLDDQNKIEKDAHRNYVKGAVLSSIQDAERHAYVNAKEDGSDLYQLYDSKIAEMGLVKKFTEGKDEDEAKYLEGNILTLQARARGAILTPFLKRGMQAAERKAENTLNDMVNSINSHSDIVNTIEEWSNTLGDTKKYSTGLVKQSFDGIKNTVLNRSVEGWVRTRLKQIVDEVHTDKGLLEEPDYREFDKLDILLKPNIEVDDVDAEKDILAFRAATGNNEPTPGTKTWETYLLWRWENNKPLGYKDMQFVAGVNEEDSGSLSEKSVVKLRKEILAARNTLAGEIRLRVNDKIAKDKEISDSVETAHQLDVMADIAKGNVTTAKKKMEQAIRGESWLDEYKDEKMPDVMKGKPLLPINFMKYTDTKYYQVRDRETTRGFAKEVYNFTTGAKNDKGKPYTIGDIEKYVTRRMQENRFSPSSALTVSRTLRTLKKSPTSGKNRTVRNQLISIPFKKYLSLSEEEQTPARLEKTLQKAMLLSKNFDNRFGTGTDGGQPQTGKVIKDIEKGAQSIEQTLAVTDDDLKVERDSIINNYSELVTTFQSAGKTFPMGRGAGTGSWPLNYKPLMRLTGYTKEQIKTMSHETLHEEAENLDNFRVQIKSLFARSSWWQDKDSKTIRTRGQLYRKIQIIYNSSGRLMDMYRQQAAINLSKQKKAGSK